MPQVTIRALLARLGLTISQQGEVYGYTWRGRLWVGSFKSEYAALQAAFDEAIEIMNTERPYGQSDDNVWWQWHNGWQYIGTLEQEKESEVQP